MISCRLTTPRIPHNLDNLGPTNITMSSVVMPFLRTGELLCTVDTHPSQFGHTFIVGHNSVHPKHELLRIWLQCKRRLSPEVLKQHRVVFLIFLTAFRLKHPFFQNWPS